MTRFALAPEGADRAQVRRFLVASRRFVVFRADHLVDALPEPFANSVETVQQLVALYRDHRRVLPTGKTESAKVRDPATGTTTTVTMPVMHDEVLTDDELGDLIAWAQEEQADRRAKAGTP